MKNVSKNVEDSSSQANEEEPTASANLGTVPGQIGASLKKVLIDYEPFSSEDPQKHWVFRGWWPAKWIGSGKDERLRQANVYRNSFEVSEKITVRIHVTADAKYRLWVDGEFLAMGPEQGDVNNYFFDSYDLTLEPGKHTLTAMVFSFGEDGPYSQMGIRHGFLLGAEGDLAAVLDTSPANWQYKPVTGFGWNKAIGGMVAEEIVFDRNQFPDGIEVGLGDGWQAPEEYLCGANAQQRNEFTPQQLLRPATLPPMLDRSITGMEVRFVGESTSAHIERKHNIPTEHSQWQTFLQGECLTVPAGTVRKVLVDLNEYYCAYPYLIVSGGKDARVSVSWAEGLFTQDDIWGKKGNRGDWGDKYFLGIADTFISNGDAKQQFYTHWWRSGRWVELTVETGAESLVLERLDLREKRYPLEMMSRFECSDDRVNHLIQPCLRTLQMCSHDTFMDCPYYEQLMYIGDTRLQALITYVISDDTRLVEKAMRMFAASQLHNGLLQSRYPSRFTQVIPTFSLLWLGMLHDYVLWRNGDITRDMLAVARRVVDTFESWINREGLLQIGRGWNFVDWTEPWCRDGVMGIPPQGEFGVSGVVNWMYAYALRLMAEMHELTGAAEFAKYYRRRGQELGDRLMQTFWRDEQGLFADTLEGDNFSEHTQCLALLSGFISDSYRQRLETTLFEEHDWAKATVYFSFYLFEAYREFGRGDKIMERLQLWFDYSELDLKTLLEQPEPSRSDCHAWSSHPLFHYFATFLGIRPGEPGFQTVEIRPLPGTLEQLQGTMPHPNGMIDVKYAVRGSCLEAEVELPEGLSGTMAFAGKECSLKPGRQTLVFKELS